MNRLFLIVPIALTAGSVVLLAQTPADLTQAAATITEADLVRHASVFTDDSMRGRDTPSRELELTAQYVVDQFKQLGLQPQHDSPWLQRYPVPISGRLDNAKSILNVITFIRKNGEQIIDESEDPVYKWIKFDFATHAHFVPELMSRVGPVLRDERKAVLITGRHTAASIQRTGMTGRLVIYIPPTAADSIERLHVVAALYEAGNDIIVVGPEDSASFARRQDAARQHPPEYVAEYASRQILGAGTWAIEVWPGAVAEALVAAGVELAEARAERAPQTRELPVMASPQLVMEQGAGDTATAPNVVAMLPGTDSGYFPIIISANLDDVGLPGTQAHRMARHTRDNGGALAGLIALAKALSQPGARPRSSVLFVAVSGGAKDRWGSSYFASLRPAANTSITLEEIGRSSGGALTIEGMGDAKFAVSPIWVASMHPELELTITDGGTAFYGAADPFLRSEIPAVSIRDGADVPDSVAAPPTLDTAQAVRTLRYTFYLAHELSKAKQRPMWTSDGRRRFVEAPSP